MNLGILDSLKGLVSPKIALTALHKNLESSLGHTVEFFQMVYEKANNEIYFIVLCPDGVDRKCPFPDGKNIISIVETMSKEKLKPGDSLDIVILQYNNIPPSEKLFSGDQWKEQQALDEFNKNSKFKIIAAYRNANGQKLKIEEPI